MRNTFGLGLALFVSVALAACGPAQLTIFVEPASGEGESMSSLDGIEVRLLPYDRDQVFDSLTDVADTPEPQIPDDLLAMRDEIAAAQRQWLDNETQWNTLRDTLAKLNSAMEGLNRGESQYRRIFNEWSDLNAQYERAERRVAADFARFESLQAAGIGRMDSMRVAQANWADQAFADVDMVFGAKMEMSGLDQAADTTGVEGVAQFEVPPGRYWVYARYERPYDELYWNEPVDVARGEPAELRLTGENAEVRPIF